MFRFVVFQACLLPFMACDLMAQTIWLGADLSYVNEMEDCGAVFRDNGRKRDVYELFAEKGANIVRLRLWHNPDWTSYSTLKDVKRSIHRARNAGMAVLLDFHYSDDWADPGDQIIPKAWEGLEGDELATEVYRYTCKVLHELDDEGLMPEMVQVGNEINTEVLLPKKVSEDKKIDWARNAKMINAGIRAVREVGRSSKVTPKVMLHVAQPEYVRPWMKDAIKAGVLDFEQIGISYYPKWSRCSMAELGQTIRRLRHEFGKEVIVVETAYPWTMDGNDSAGNILGRDSLTPEYPATLAGQKRFLTELTQTVIAHDGMGVVYWEPAWVSSNAETRWGKGSHWENNTFFDYKETNAHTGFDFFTHSYTEPKPITFQFEVEGEIPDGSVYFWSDVFNDEAFVVPLTRTGKTYEFTMRIMPKQKFRFRLFKDNERKQAIIMDLNGKGEGPSKRSVIKAIVQF